MRRFVTQAVAAIGIVYVAVGILGFVVTGLTGFAATEGSSLLGFEVNPLHNIVHVGVGVALLAGAAAGTAGMRGTAGLIAAVYALVGIAGFFIIGTDLNILALNTADNVLHLASAAALGYLAVAAGETSRAEARPSPR